MSCELSVFTLAVVYICAVTNVHTAPATSNDDANRETTNNGRTYLDCLEIPTWFDGTTKLSPQQLDTLPGLGFDSLRNLDMGQVFDYDYSSCKTAMNGRFLIPESSLVVPLQESHYKLDAEIFDHWDNYTSLTSSGVRFGGQDSSKQAKLSGSFSREKQSVKINQINHNSTTTRVVFRNRVLSVSLDVSAKLHPTFRDRVYEIAASVQNNDSCMADYLSELLIREYGTHYISSVEAGAIVVKLDYIRKEYMRHFTKDSLTKSAQLTFPIFSLFNNNVGFNITSTDYESHVTTYHENKQRTEIFTIGGSPLTPNFDLTAWLNDIPNKMAIINRAADPLHYAITWSKFPKLQSATTREIGKYIQNSTERYYEINSKPGCLHLGNKNFDYGANVRDDTKCNNNSATVQKISTFSFGGTYQNCLVRQGINSNICSKLDRTNENTGSHSCPEDYMQIELVSGSIAHTDLYTEMNKKCSFLWFWCHTDVNKVERVSRAFYDAYWCVANTQLSQSYYFGGYFTSSDNNLITGEKSCPPHFQGQMIASDITLCTSSDALASPYAVEFGGFFSCKHGNPLAAADPSHFGDKSKWPKSCGSGFSQHHVAVDNGCEINVCLVLGAFTQAQLLPPILPPFHKRPSYVPYWSGDRLAVFGAENIFLIRETSGQWESYSGDDNNIKTFVEAAAKRSQEMSNSNDMPTDTKTATEAPEAAQSMNESVNGPSDTAVAALVLVILAILCFAVIFAIFIMYIKRNI